MDKIDGVPPILSLKEKEAKEETGIKMLTLNKLLIIFTALLVQIKAGNNSNKLKKTQAHTISFVSAS